MSNRDMRLQLQNIKYVAETLLNTLEGPTEAQHAFWLFADKSILDRAEAELLAMSIKMHAELEA